MHICCDKRNFFTEDKSSALRIGLRHQHGCRFLLPETPNMVDVTSCVNGGVSKTFPWCISTEYRPSLSTTSKWPACKCDSNKLFHKGAFDRLYSGIGLYAEICDKFMRIFGPFQCYIHLNCLFSPKFVILPFIWGQTSNFQSLFHLFLFRNNIQSNFAVASTICSRSAWQRGSRFRLWNTWLCFRGPSGLGTSLSRTKNSS